MVVQITVESSPTRKSLIKLASQIAKQLLKEQAVLVTSASVLLADRTTQPICEYRR